MWIVYEGVWISLGLREWNIVVINILFKGRCLCYDKGRKIRAPSFVIDFL